MSKKSKKAKNAVAVTGRPSAFTDQVVKKLEEAFCMDFTITEACAYAGISRQAYYDECDRNPAFLDKMEQSQQFAFALAKKGLFEALKKGDGALILKWLKNRQPDRYHEKIEQDVKQVPIEEVLDGVEGNVEYSEKFQTGETATPLPQ